MRGLIENRLGTLTPPDLQPERDLRRGTLAQRRVCATSKARASKGKVVFQEEGFASKVVFSMWLFLNKDANGAD